MLPTTNLEPPFRITRASHVALSSRNLEASRDFYRDVIGLVVSEEGDDAVYLRGLEESAHHSLTLYRENGDDAHARYVGFRVQRDVRAASNVISRQGRSDSPRRAAERVLDVCRTVPTIVVIYLDHPAIITEIASSAAALLIDFGVTDGAVVDVLTGRAPAHGRLPLDIPSSMAAVIASAPDAPFDTSDPSFRFGDRYGLPGTSVSA